MPELNVSLPPLEVLVPSRFIFSEPQTDDNLLEGCLVSACSIPGSPLLFQVLFRDGALYERIPIHRLQWRRTSCEIDRLTDKQVWDCPSYNVTVNKYDLLQNAQVTTKFGTFGEYQWTFDWYGDDISEGVGDLGHKAAHFIKLSNGYFAALPNDYCQFDVSAWVTKPFSWTAPPKYRRNNKKWVCE